MTERSRVVGRYEIVGRLGRGGMAVVHLARQIDLDRMIALKELSALDSEDPAYARRFLQESRLGGSLSHPAIVHVYDYFEHDGTPFIAMEYVAGGTMRPHVGHITFAQIIGVLDAMLAALTYAEREGIVHRDLKPENVLVSPEGYVKIADFGIAKAINRVNPSGFLTATGMAIGTPAYMAPEQAMAGAVGPWTDLYALGCMAYELFTSTIPFAAPDNQMAMLVRRINEPIPPPDTVNPALPGRLSAWIDGLLARDPEARTRSAETAADELEDIVIGIAGARWRRNSRLPTTAVEAEVDPLTTTGALRRPATRGTIEERFGEAEAAAGTEGRPEFLASTDVETPPPDDAIPGPYTPPPDDAIPGPYTPPPDDAIPGPYTPPPDDAFVTYRPSAEAPDDPTAPLDLVPAKREDEPMAAPADEGAGGRADETASAPDEDAQTGRYETYREPPPLRPPTGPEPERDLQSEPEPEPPQELEREPSSPPPPSPVTTRSPTTELGGRVPIPPDTPPRPAEPAPTPEPGGTRDRRRHGRWIAAGVGVVALLAVAGSFLTRSSPPESPKKASVRGGPFDFYGDGRQSLVMAPFGSGQDEEGLVLVYRDPGGDTNPMRITERFAGVPGTPDTDDDFGSALASADFNGDGNADLAIGVRGKDRVSVVYGTRSGLEDEHTKQLAAPTPPVGQAISHYGSALMAADFNGDHYGDLAVGAPGRNEGDSGAVRLLFGGKQGLTQAGGEWVKPPRGNERRFGSRLATGDINQDSRADLLEGAPDDSVQRRGHGSYCRGTAEGELRCRQLGDGGTSSLAVSDVTGDGNFDVIQGESDPAARETAGEVRVWPGSGNGPRKEPITIDQEKLTGLGLRVNIGDEFGAVVDAANLDGDQFGDMVIAAPQSNDGLGRVLIIRGGPPGYARGEDQPQPIGPSSVGVEEAPPGAQFGSTLALIRSSSSRDFDLAITMQGLVKNAADTDDTLEGTVVVVPDVRSLLRGGSARAVNLPGLELINAASEERIRLGRPPHD